jgi:hypothetical protein
MEGAMTLTAEEKRVRTILKQHMRVLNSELKKIGYELDVMDAVEAFRTPRIVKEI